MKYKDFEKITGEKLKNVDSHIDRDALIAALEKSGAFAVQKSPKKKWILLSIIVISLLSAGIFFFNSSYPKNTKTKEWVNSVPSPTADFQSDDSEVRLQSASPIFDNSVRSNIKSDITINSQHSTAIENVKGEMNQNSTTDRGLKHDFVHSNALPDKAIQPEVILHKEPHSPIAEGANDHVNVPDHPGSVTSMIYPQIKLLPIKYQLFQNVLPDFAMDARKDECPVFGKPSPFRLELIPEVGGFLPIKQLMNRSGEINEVYSLRDQGERTLEGLQAGLYGRITHRDIPVYLQTGILYSRISEKMDLAYSYVRSDTTRGVISVTVSQMGDTITTIYGDIVTETQVNGRTIRHHFHRFLDLPLMLGYQHRGRYVDIGIEAGALINVFMRSSGYILDTPESFVNLNEQSPFKSRLGVSYVAGVNVSKPVGIGSVYLALRYRHIPDNITVEQASIQQTYRQVGLNLGYILPIF